MTIKIVTEQYVRNWQPKNSMLANLARTGMNDGALKEFHWYKQVTTELIILLISNGNV